MTERLRDAKGRLITVDEGESCNIQLTLKDMADPSVTISSLTLTLYDDDTDGIINGRNGQDINNANGSSFASGLVTVELDGDDNVVVGTASAGALEWHVVRLGWSWNDGDSVRTGAKEYGYAVKKLAVVS